MKRIACIGIGFMLFAGLLGGSAIAQGPASQSQSQSNSTNPAAGTSSGSSLGDYAKQIKKAPASKPKVFDNDNLPTDDKLSIVGTPATSGSDSSSNASKTDTASAAGENKAQGNADSGEAKPPSGLSPAAEQSAKEALWKQWGDKVTAQKDQVDLLGRELNVLQREYQIRAAAMYGDAGNRLRNEADWDKQDVQYKQQIADKQKSLDDAKQKLEDMQEEARKAGVPSSYLGE